jgi:hypothetical protein
MQPRAVKRALTWTAITAVLLGVFAMYARPEFLVTLADQLWACF